MSAVTQKELSDILHRLNYQSEIDGYRDATWSFDDLAIALLRQFTILYIAPVAAPPKKFCNALAEGIGGETYECHRPPDHEEWHDWDHRIVHPKVTP